MPGVDAGGQAHGLDDDITGYWLDPTLVEVGCASELRRFKEMGVYTPILHEDALADPEMKVVGVMWVKAMPSLPNSVCECVFVCARSLRIALKVVGALRQLFIVPERMQVNRIAQMAAAPLQI